MTFLETLAQLVASQFLSIGLIFFVFLFLLSKISDLTLTNYYSAVGWKGILWTAWIGTPIHELSHAIMAKLFGHKVTKISLFRPHGTNGTLGYVDHTYDRKNFFHQIGVFFVGIAPLISGSIALIALTYWLLPNGKEIIKTIFLNNLSWQELPNFLIATGKQIFSYQNFSQPIFPLFLYLSFAVASHMSPSRSDMRGFWQGLAFVVVITMIIDAILLLFFPVEQIKYTTLSAVYFCLPILFYALGVTCLQYCFSILVRLIFQRR